MRGKYFRKYTGKVIAPIGENQIFVFSSYSNGYNKAGTAKAALRYFGAQPGVGNGRTGQSYAIPSEVSLGIMQEAVETFIIYASSHPELEFLVTPIGKGGIFKREPKLMASLFINALECPNIILPKEFVDIIDPDVQFNPDDILSKFGVKPDYNQRGKKIEKVPRQDYFVLEHTDCEFNDSAVARIDGKYSILQLDNIQMGGYWEGFKEFRHAGGYDEVRIPVPTRQFTDEDDFLRCMFYESCVLVKKDGFWGCIDSKYEHLCVVLVPVVHRDIEDVIAVLDSTIQPGMHYSWISFKEYKNTTNRCLARSRGIDVFVGDIVKQPVEAIVNAANRTLLGGGGIDGCIHQAAGPGLLAECRTLNGCSVGKCKITQGYNLPAKYVIHAVGPDCRVMSVSEAEPLLRSCYKSVLDIAQQYRLSSICFCCISTGIFKFPKDRAAMIAMEEIVNHPYDGEIHICCFTPEDKIPYDDYLSYSR